MHTKPRIIRKQSSRHNQIRERIAGDSIGSLRDREGRRGLMPYLLSAFHGHQATPEERMREAKAYINRIVKRPEAAAKDPVPPSENSLRRSLTSILSITEPSDRPAALERMARILADESGEIGNEFHTNRSKAFARLDKALLEGYPRG